MIAEDIEYIILDILDTKELRPLRVVCKEWKKIIDILRIKKLRERIYINKLYRVYYRWTIYTILCINRKRNYNSWESKSKKEEREILLF